MDALLIFSGSARALGITEKDRRAPVEYLYQARNHKRVAYRINVSWVAAIAPGLAPEAAPAGKGTDQEAKE